MNDTRIKISIESQLVNLPILRKAIRGLCSFVIQDEQVFQDIDLCLNEALSNVIYHAYRNEPGHEIEIIITLHPKEFVFQIIDLGLKNPQENVPSALNPDLNNLDSLQESGRGLFLIHQLMDEVVYKSEKDRNILLLRKRFN
jgi:serine/threonine-protein kinase RsbW